MILKPVQPETVRLASDLPYSMVLLAFRMPGFNSPDFAAAQVLADVLDSRRGRFTIWPLMAGLWKPVFKSIPFPNPVWVFSWRLSIKTKP